MAALKSLILGFRPCQRNHQSHQSPLTRVSRGKRQRRQQRQPSIAGLRLGRVEIIHSWIQAVPAVPTNPSEPSESIEKSEPVKEAQKTPEAAQRSIAGLRLGSVEITHAWIQAVPTPPSERAIEKSGPGNPGREAAAEKTAEAAQHSRIETWQWQRRNHSFLDSGRANATIRAIRVH